MMTTYTYARDKTTIKDKQPCVITTEGLVASLTYT